jgi:ABC-2 type transport system ATP-binding protein
MSEVLLEANQLSKNYAGHQAVTDFSLSIKRGEICALLGQNGAGKSSILRMLTGIFLPDTGSVKLYTQRKLGYLPEERGLYPNMTVQEQLEYIAQLRGLSAKEAREKAANELTEIGLQTWKNKQVKQLSKGMQQKVQILATILHEPELLILDEPFSGLDPVSLELVCKLFNKLKQQGAGILISTHEMKVAESVSDSLCLLKAGKVVWSGKTENLKAHFGQNTYHVSFKSDSETPTSWTESLKALMKNSRQLYVNGADALLRHYEIEFEPTASLSEIVSMLANNYALQKFEHYSPDLEEAFKRLTA